MINLKLKSVRIIFYLLIICVSLGSCIQQKSKDYYYAYFYEDDKAPSAYAIRRVANQNGYRMEVISFYTADLSLDHKETNRYIVKENGIDRVEGRQDSVLVKPYLSVSTTDCINYLYEQELMNDFLSTKLCFIGRETVSLNGKVYKDAYKFKKKKGTIDGVESVVYYDSDFIPIKEEYVSGYTDKYSIVRLDTAIAVVN